MLKILCWPVRIFCALIILLLSYLNFNLYDERRYTLLPDGGHLHPEVMDQLHFLQRKLRYEQAGEEAQLLYPEGFVFIYALYALAWCDVVATLPPESTSSQEGIAEIAFSLRMLDSPAGRRVFNPDLPLTYGAFYRGWTAYLHGRYLQLRPLAERDSATVRQFQNECSAIAEAIGQTQNTYLESYRGMSWPADNMVCLAALALHDHITTSRFQVVRKAWLDRMQRDLSPGCPLISHGYDLAGNRPSGGVRGSSQVLMLNFLLEVDSAFAQLQYKTFRQQFLTYRLGLPGIREYPHGSVGMGDVDSGPVVMGVGGAASIVGIRAAARYGDWEVFSGLRSGVEALLLPQHSGGEKKYVFGHLPVVDAFMAWSNASVCPKNVPALGNWRWKFQVISVLLAALCVFLMWKMRAV